MEAILLEIKQISTELLLDPEEIEFSCSKLIKLEQAKIVKIKLIKC